MDWGHLARTAAIGAAGLVVTVFFFVLLTLRPFVVGPLKALVTAGSTVYLLSLAVAYFGDRWDVLPTQWWWIAPIMIIGSQMIIWGLDTLVARLAPDREAMIFET